jgi:hypothetical protein
MLLAYSAGGLAVHGTAWQAVLSGTRVADWFEHAPPPGTQDPGLGDLRVPPGNRLEKLAVIA